VIILRGVPAFKAACDKKIAQMDAATRRATIRSLHLLERRAKEKLAIRSHERGTPTPSDPGDPPALVSGNLRRSIRVEGPHPIGPHTWRGQVGPTAEYGRIQELGGEIHTRIAERPMFSAGQAGTGTPIPARPYMDPALRESLDEIRAIFVEEFRKAILE